MHPSWLSRKTPRKVVSSLNHLQVTTCSLRSLLGERLLSEEELKNLRAVTVNKKKLYTENFLFVGVPVLRAF
jgi:hypothetical protein